MKVLKIRTLNFIVALISFVTCAIAGPVPVDPARMDFSSIGEPVDLKPEIRAPSFNEPTFDIPVVGSGNKLTIGGSVSLDFYMFKHAKTLDKKNDWDRHDQYRQRNEFSALFQACINPVTNNPMVKSKISIGNTLFLRTLFSPLDYNNSTVANGSSYDFNQSPSQVKFQEAWAEVDLGEVFKDKSKAKNYIKFGYFPFLVGRGISLGDWAQGGPQYLGFDRVGVQTYSQMYPGGIMAHVGLYQGTGIEFYYSPSVSEDIAGAQRTGGVIIERDVRESYGRHVFAVSGKFVQQTKAASIVVNPYWVYYNSPRQSVDVAMDAPINLHTVGMMIHAKSGAMEFNAEVAKQSGHQIFKKRTYQDFPSTDHYNFNNATSGQYLWNGSDLTNNTAPTPPALGSSSSLSPEVYAYSSGATPTTDEWRDYNIPGYNSYAQRAGNFKLGEHHPEFEISLSGWMAAFDAKYKCKDYPLAFSMAVGYFSGGEYPYNDNVDKFWFSPSGEKISKFYTVDPDVTTVLAPGTPRTPSRAKIAPTAKKDFKGFIGIRDYRYVGMWAQPLIMVNAGIVPRPKELSYFDFVAYNDSDSLSDIFMVGYGVECQPLAEKEKLTCKGNFFAYWKDSKLRKWDKLAKKDFKIQKADGQSGGDLAVIQGWESDLSASSFYGFEVSGLLNWKITRNVELSLRGGFFVPGQLYKDVEGMPNSNALIDVATIDPVKGAQEATIYGSLGHDIPWGIYSRIRYWF